MNDEPRTAAEIAFDRRMAESYRERIAALQDQEEQLMRWPQHDAAFFVSRWRHQANSPGDPCAVCGLANMDICSGCLSFGTLDVWVETLIQAIEKSKEHECASASVERGHEVYDGETPVGQE